MQIKSLVAVILLSTAFAQPVYAQHKDMPHKGHGHHGGHKKMNPAKLDLVTEKMSAAGHFKVAISSQTTPVKINSIHAWVLDIKNHSGKPLSDADVVVDGGMPAHGHGLPTAPRVTKKLGDGKYQVEGVRFNMRGHWKLTFDITSAQMSDKVTFNLMIN